VRRGAAVTAVAVAVAAGAWALLRGGDSAFPAPRELTVAGSWAAPNADLAGSRAAPGSKIDTHSVGRLRRLWRFTLDEPPTFSGVLASTPLVLAGRVFVQTLHSNVYALDADTGKVVWKLRLERDSGGPNGLAAGGGRLFGSTDTSLFALDPSTGAVAWTRRLTGAQEPIDMAPAVAGGLVFTGSTAQHPGGKGRLYAVDATTGRVRWRLTTVRDAWADPAVASGGSLWWTPTLGDDGRLYVGTGNPLPWGGTPAAPNGRAYAGPALYTDTLLALDARTGSIEWYDQVTPHDVRDYDFSLPPILARAGGRDLVVGGGKGGRVVAWDRRSHRRLWTASVGLHRNDEGPLPRQPVQVCPGLLGGILTPMAHAGGRIYVPVVDLCMRGSAVGYESFMSADYASGRGELVALDAATGARVWTRKLPSPVFGCATASADLVVTATYDGRVYAVDADTGATRWSAREPAGVNGCPAVAGDLLVVPAGAEPSTIPTPTPVVDAYRLAPR
jgi:outer membrane protein assembly factor BamB